jgi:hypothetical protein
MINKKLFNRIEIYFDQLNFAIDSKNWDKADLLLAKLSVFYVHFDELQQRLFEEAQEIVERETAIVIK